MIKLINITKKYNNIILNNVNLQLYEGNIYVIKGISGSGKTTLLNIISLLDSDYEGEYFYKNKKISLMSEKEKSEIKKNISYEFQKSYLFKSLTIRENLLFINDDNNLIEYYAKKFNIESILDKKAEAISGGERQRVSLIRALISNSEVIILDEPTSSLDKNNSLIFSHYLKKLDLRNKIVIISTHKNIYDDFASNIFNIQYGKITSTHKNNNYHNYQSCNNHSVNYNFKYDLLFVKKRKKKRVVLLLMLILFFLLLNVIISLLVNVKKEIIIKYTEKYPLHVLNIKSNSLEYVNLDIKKIYDNYLIKTYEFDAYTLLEKSDSYIGSDETIEYGTYPKKYNDILVTMSFFNSNYENCDFKEIIGKKLTINDQDFYISGILNDNIQIFLSNNVYRNIINEDDSIKPSIFIPYEKMKEIGEKTNDVIITISKDNTIELYNNGGEISFGNMSFSFDLPWLSKIENSAFVIYNYSLTIVFVFILIIIFLFFFFVSKISLELFYRKKEIGFLRLLNISNARIKRIYILDYFWEVIMAYIISIILFGIICCYVKYKFGMNFFIPIFINLLLIIMVLLYFYLLIIIPLLKYLKRDILKCINN